MGETTTDSQGRFELSGSNAEVSTIDPKINIYHDCEDWWWVSQIYKVSFNKERYEEKTYYFTHNINNERVSHKECCSVLDRGFFVGRYGRMQGEGEGGWLLRPRKR